MTRTHLRTYLRTRRLEHGLSQAELAELLDIHADSVSDYEREKATMPANLIVAGEIIFGEHASKLFPAFYKRVQDSIGARAARMYERLDGVENETAKKKLRLLSGIPSRTKKVGDV